MTTPTYPAPSELLRMHLDVLAYEARAQGITVEIREGSELYKRGKANAQRAAVAIAANKISLDDSNPLTAQDPALTTLAGVFGVYPRPAGKAAGGVLIVCSGTVTIPEGFTGTIGGQRYQTTTKGTYTSGSTVEVQALVGGSGGNQDAGAIFTWDSAAIGTLSQTAIVDAAGLHDGVEADDQERLRTRLLKKLAAPPVGGNWAMAVEVAEGSSASIEAAYAYPAAQGPASLDIAATSAGGGRTLSSTTLDIIRAALAAEYPGQEQITVTTVTVEPMDITLAASLPLPLSASGIGGGWRDPVPWPAEDTKVTSFSSGTATVNSTAAPSIGTSIGLWDPTYLDNSVTPPKAGIMREFTIATVGGSAGAWTITVQGGFNGFGGNPTGAYVSAGAVRLVEYARTFADAVALLGPGQKTDIPELLPRATRQPSPDVRAPSDLTSRLIGAVQDTYGEITDLQWGRRYLTGTATTATTPPLPATTADPPKVFTLKFFAIRKL